MYQATAGTAAARDEVQAGGVAVLAFTHRADRLIAAGLPTRVARTTAVGLAPMLGRRDDADRAVTPYLAGDPDTGLR